MQHGRCIGGFVASWIKYFVCSTSLFLSLSVLFISCGVGQEV